MDRLGYMHVATECPGTAAHRSLADWPADGVAGVRACTAGA